MIERFVQLREIYSNFDSNGNANLPEPLNENDKPIIASLIKFDKSFEWFLPISNNRKKLYDLDKTIADELVDTTAIDIVVLDQALVAEDEEIEKYYKGGFPADENKYVYLFKALNQYVTPFEVPINQEQSITSQRVNTNILSVVDNLGDLESIVADAPPPRAFGSIGPKILTRIEKKKFLLENIYYWSYLS